MAFPTNFRPRSPSAFVSPQQDPAAQTSNRQPPDIGQFQWQDQFGKVQLRKHEFVAAIEEYFGGDMEKLHRYVSSHPNPEAVKAILNNSPNLQAYLGVEEPGIRVSHNQGIDPLEAPAALAQAAVFLDSPAAKKRALDNLQGLLDSIPLAGQGSHSLFTSSVEQAAIQLAGRMNDIGAIKVEALNKLHGLLNNIRRAGPGSHPPFAAPVAQATMQLTKKNSDIGSANTDKFDDTTNAQAFILRCFPLLSQTGQNATLQHLPPPRHARGGAHWLQKQWQRTSAGAKLLGGVGRALLGLPSRRYVFRHLEETAQAYSQPGAGAGLFGGQRTSWGRALFGGLGGGLRGLSTGGHVIQHPEKVAQAHAKVGAGAGPFGELEQLFRRVPGGEEGFKQLNQGFAQQMRGIYTPAVEKSFVELAANLKQFGDSSFARQNIDRAWPYLSPEAQREIQQHLNTVPSPPAPPLPNTAPTSPKRPTPSKFHSEWYGKQSEQSAPPPAYDGPDSKPATPSQRRGVSRFDNVPGAQFAPPGVTSNGPPEIRNFAGDHRRFTKALENYFEDKGGMAALYAYLDAAPTDRENHALYVALNNSHRLCEFLGIANEDAFRWRHSPERQRIDPSIAPRALARAALHANTAKRATRAIAQLGERIYNPHLYQPDRLDEKTFDRSVREGIWELAANIERLPSVGNASRAITLIWGQLHRLDEAQQRAILTKFTKGQMGRDPRHIIAEEAKKVEEEKKEGDLYDALYEVSSALRKCINALADGNDRELATFNKRYGEKWGKLDTSIQSMWWAHDLSFALSERLEFERAAHPEPGLRS